MNLAGLKVLMAIWNRTVQEASRSAPWHCRSIPTAKQF